MREIDKKKLGKVLLLILKVVLAIPLTVVFIVIRGIQFFLKMCGAVVSFVCIVSAVMLSIGVLVEIVFADKRQRSGHSGNYPDHGSGRRFGIYSGGRSCYGYGGA